MILPLCSAPERPQQQCWVQFWTSQYEKDILERLKLRATQMSKGLEHLTHEGKHRDLGMFNSVGILPTCINTVKKTEPYCIVPKERMRVNGQKVKYRKFDLNT